MINYNIIYYFHSCRACVSRWAGRGLKGPAAAPRKTWRNDAQRSRNAQRETGNASSQNLRIAWR